MQKPDEKSVMFLLSKTGLNMVNRDDKILPTSVLSSPMTIKAFKRLVIEHDGYELALAQVLGVSNTKVSRLLNGVHLRDWWAAFKSKRRKRKLREKKHRWYVAYAQRREANARVAADYRRSLLDSSSDDR